MSKEKRSKLFGFLAGLAVFAGSYAIAGATFSVYKTWSNGEILTAADLNASFQTILTNLTPAGVDDFSLDVTEMRSVADPYPATTESQATALSGEIERLRYQILQIKKAIQPSNITYWYQDPPAAGAFTILGSSIGVNNTSPSYALDVTGDLRVTGAINVAATNFTHVRAHLSSDVSADGGVGQNISNWTSIYDALSELGTTTFTATTAGYYMFTFTPVFDLGTSTVSFFGAGLVVNSTSTYILNMESSASYLSNRTIAPRSIVLRLNASDEVLVRVAIVSASALMAYDSRTTTASPLGSDFPENPVLCYTEYTIDRLF